MIYQLINIANPALLNEVFTVGLFSVGLLWLRRYEGWTAGYQEIASYCGKITANRQLKFCNVPREIPTVKISLTLAVLALDGSVFLNQRAYQDERRLLLLLLTR